MEYLYLATGLVLILAGANYLTDGSAALAARFRVPGFLVGLTVIAVGTSTPELVVSVLSALEGQGDMAVGNVVGSNLFNIYVILGVCALIRPLPLTRQNIRRDLPVGLGAAVVLCIVLADEVLHPGHPHASAARKGSQCWHSTRSASGRPPVPHAANNRPKTPPPHGRWPAG